MGSVAAGREQRVGWGDSLLGEFSVSALRTSNWFDHRHMRMPLFAARQSGTIINIEKGQPMVRPE